MDEQLVFQQMNLVRKMTIKELEGVTEEEADVVPKHFRNNLRWNFGHIYTVQQLILKHHAGMALDIDPTFEKLFSPGTSPDDWEGLVPTLEEIKGMLETQGADIEEAMTGKLSEDAQEPFIHQNNVGQILTFTFYHEGLHLSTIKSYKRLIQAQ